MSIQVINLTPRRIAIDEEKYNSVVAFLNEGVPISSIISATKLSKASIYRIKDELLYSGRREFKKRGRKVKNASEQITQIKTLLWFAELKGKFRKRTPMCKNANEIHDRIEHIIQEEN